jgi:hypothetical protein
MKGGSWKIGIQARLGIQVRLSGFERERDGGWIPGAFGPVYQNQPQ